MSQLRNTLLLLGKIRSRLQSDKILAPQLAADIQHAKSILDKFIMQYKTKKWEYDSEFQRLVLCILNNNGSQAQLQENVYRLLPYTAITKGSEMVYLRFAECCKNYAESDPYSKLFITPEFFAQLGHCLNIKKVLV